MSIELDLIIDAPTDSVDMKAGLDSMQGVSDTIRCAAESILSEKVPERHTPKSSVRTSLKRSFKGSYGHTFTLDIHSDAYQQRLGQIGLKTFISLIAHFIDSALYRDTPTLTKRAEKALQSLAQIEDAVVEQLRQSSLRNAHEIVTKFKHNVKIRHRSSASRQFVIAEFDQESAKVLKATLSSKLKEIDAVITRLNIHTGNGRLQLRDANETVAFGFGTTYKEVRIEAKKVFSSNLDSNNGVAERSWQYLKLGVSPIELRNGRVVKYIIKRFN